MNYIVELTPMAEAELIASFWYIHEQTPLNAQRWLQGIYDAIDSLETWPHRCASAPEAEYLDALLKHHRFKSHRIIFVIDEDTKTVRILFVRHESRRAIGEPYEDNND